MSKFEQIVDQQELDEAARMFKALSNPHRLRIFKELSSCLAGQVITEPSEDYQNCQRKFADHLGLAPSTVSHHFKELRNAGLIHMRREGKNVIFWVDDKATKALQALLNT